MHKRNQLDYLEAEGKIFSGIKHYWGVGVADLGEPYHGGYCLVDPDGRLIAWLRLFCRKDLSNGLKFDVRRLIEVTPFVSASGRPLVIVVHVSGKLTYVVWKPGVADFYSYVPTDGDDQTEYGDYWDAVIPGNKLKPMGHGLPREIVLATRKATPRTTKYSRWPNLFELPNTT